MFEKWRKKKRENPLEVKLFLNTNGEHPETIFTSLGITKDRAYEIQKQIRTISENIAKTPEGYYNDVVIRELSLYCKSVNEFALAIYTFAVENTLIEVKHNGPGDFLSKLIGGGLKGAIIKLDGGMPRQSESGEDPSVEELIRQSYKINKDKPEGEEGN